MEFFRIKRDIPFMRYALIFNVISLITFIVAVGAVASTPSSTSYPRGAVSSTP